MNQPVQGYAGEEQHQPARDERAREEEPGRGGRDHRAILPRSLRRQRWRMLRNVRAWRPEHVDLLYQHRLFRLERQRLHSGAEQREALVLRAPDWVNVIPLLPDGHVLLVRQWRFGLGGPTLEIPGGMVEGEPEQAAAERELLEETGYRAAHWERLGEVQPNPAFLANRCGSWLATGLERVGEPLGDGEEEIEVTSAPLAEIPAKIARGEIAHALVIAAFYLYERRGTA